MKPTTFPEQTCVLAEDQPEYQPLPVCRIGDEVISCWELTLWDRLLVFFTGRIWLRQLTFGELLQPQLPQVESPFEDVTIE